MSGRIMHPRGGSQREAQPTGVCATTSRTGKDCGIGKYPSTSLAMNKAWQAAALTAAALLAWLRLLALDGAMAEAEPKALRPHLPRCRRLTRSSRQRCLKIRASWPWAADNMTAWHRISALPHAP
jgi:hypothetical protein